MSSFVYTTAIDKIRRMKARKKVIQGGTSAGKTFGILPELITIAATRPRTEISVVSESIPHLRRGALKDFRNIMQSTGRWVEGRFNETLLTYRFANGSYIEFFSADQPDRVRGPRRNVLYVNEANNIPFEAYFQLAIRTSHEIFIDFNPTSEFWAHTEVLTGDDAELLILTYKDNEALPATIVADIEAARDKGATSSYWANWWQVYGLGQIGSLQGVVFDNWQQIDQVPPTARYLGCGLDFGFTNDPTAMVALYLYNGQPLWDELIYQKGLLNSELANLIKSFRLPAGTIYADSADPKTIAELRGYGLNVIGATKGRDSILHGIGVLQQGQHLITKRSTNLIKEMRSYVWATDKTGATTNQPVDVFNHLQDARRYVAVNKLSLATSRAGFGAHLVR